MNFIPAYEWTDEDPQELQDIGVLLDTARQASGYAPSDAELEAARRVFTPGQVFSVDDVNHAVDYLLRAAKHSYGRVKIITPHGTIPEDLARHAVALNHHVQARVCP